MKFEEKGESRVDLTGRTAIITGAGSGIGRAMALTFARSGARVLINDILSDRAHETAQMVEKAGGDGTAHVADVADEHAVRAMVSAAVERWGRIDILCNNAGVMDAVEMIEDVSTDEWNRLLNNNLSGVFFMLRAVIPQMRAQKSGAIINTASIAALRGASAGPAYTASKHAVVGLTRNVAWTHAEDGIRCNAICPGVIDTNIMAGRTLDDFHKEGLARCRPIMMANQHSSGPQAIANAALFLASDAAYFVNGAIMPVDGGWMAG